MDEPALRARLSRAQLILGDASVTFADLFDDGIAPLGFVSFDMDHYTPTAAVLGHLGDGAGVVRAVLGGTVFGLMGTDAVGRDLAEGLLFGLPVALTIGLAASLLSTLIGACLGLVSGYAGGWTDTLIQRISDVVVNIPVLPLLIFMVFVFRAQLWLIMLVLVAFGWPGLTIMVRAMVLQLRSSPEVESAVTLGASRSRILARHVFPHIAPFVFAQLIFFAPAAILAEAGLSFLGLGDPSLPTWGQILEHGFRSGGVFLGYWWWVVPPGLLIVLTALTFMLLALGMETVVDPRLRRMRPGRRRR
jgi:peptide/nickel transport system permease protein